MTDAPVAEGDLIARKDAILELVIESTRWRAPVIHSFGKRHRNHSLLENFLHPVRQRPDCNLYDVTSGREMG